MSKSFYFASEEELQEFLLEFVKTNPTFCQILLDQCRETLKTIILEAIETNEIYDLRTKIINVDSALNFEPDAIIRKNGTPLEEAFLRFDSNTNKSLSFINKLNVDELYINGKKLNIVETTSQTLQLEANPSWN